MKKVVLLILDGMGLGKEYDGNAIYLANTKNLDELMSKYPYTELGASEEYVGLPKMQIGGSEIGHFTIGAGKIIDSDIVRINKYIKSKEFFKNKTLLEAFKNIKNKNSLHLIGLLSDGGVHSHINHLFALLDMVKKSKLNNVYLHLFGDGRDVSPKSIYSYIIKLKHYLTKLNLLDKVKIASLSGRYYGMDRDNRWDRQKLVYELLTEGKGNYEHSIAYYIKSSYKKAITDEFLIPTLFEKEGIVKDSDTIIFFNFRSDRAREFTKMFVDHTFNNFKRKKIKTNFYTLTQYDSKIKNAKVIFPPVKPNDGIAKILSKKKLKQLKIAETEKYAHVTYFFNQGKEKPYEYEDRILVPSPKVKTYDLKPEMSANQITKKLLPKLKQNYSLYVVNFANGDMVGHTGNLSATISAVETVDKCVGQIVKNVDKNTYIIITADHGNCDEMVLDNGEISTAHSLNKVPFMIITNRDIQLKSNNKLSLANIAPTVLDLLGIPIPKSMEESIIKK